MDAHYDRGTRGEQVTGKERPWLDCKSAMPQIKVSDVQSRIASLDKERKIIDFIKGRRVTELRHDWQGYSYVILYK